MRVGANVQHVCTFQDVITATLFSPSQQWAEVGGIQFWLPTSVLAGVIIYVFMLCVSTGIFHFRYTDCLYNLTTFMFIFSINLLWFLLLRYP